MNGELKVLELNEFSQEDNLYADNCDTVAAAIEDMHHRNLATMTLLDANHGVTIDPYDLLSMKFELLLDLLTEGDVFKRLQVGFCFQQRLAEHLANLNEKAHQEE